MGKRTLTGSLILIVTALFVASRYLSVYFFDAFVMAMSFMACYEVLKAMQKDERKCSRTYTYLSLVHVYLVYMAYSPFVAKSRMQTFLYQVILFVIFFLASMVCEVLYLNKHKGEEFSKDELLLSTKKLLLVMICPNTLVGTLYGINSFSVGKGTILLGLVFLIAMFTDVFAYIIGCATRKGSFANQISPKKSMSGAIGGILGGVVISVAIYLIFIVAGVYNPFKEVQSWKLLVFFLLAGVLGSFATESGDLVASCIKRNYDTKDFGKILPGHGGVMDRIDGMMFVSLTVYILSLIIII